VIFGLTAQEWTAIATGLLALTALAALLFAGWQVLETRKLRLQEFRPWVTVGFHFRSNIAFVVIRIEAVAKLGES
jgi:hypothetical protein